MPAKRKTKSVVGGRRPAQRKAKPQFGIDGAAARTQHERWLAEQARLLNLSNDAIIVRDPEDRITYWSNGAEKMAWGSYPSRGAIAFN